MASLGVYEPSKEQENIEINIESTSCNSISKYVNPNDTPVFLAA